MSESPLIPGYPAGSQLTAQANLLLTMSRALDVPGEYTFRKMEQLVVRARDLLEASGIDDASILDALRQMLAVAEDADLEDWQDEYRRLFDETGEMPLFESLFCEAPTMVFRSNEPLYFLHDIGLSSTLVRELEFFALLLRMRAQAERAGNVEGANATALALQLFSRHHSGTRLTALCTRIAAQGTYPIYARFASALKGVWAEVSRMNGLHLQH